MSIQRAVIFSVFERYYGFVLAFVSTIAISRLLTPAEVGKFSVAMSIAGVASCFREFGASSFLIRSAEIEDRHEACAFGLALVLGVGLGVALLASAEPLASFFDQSDVAGLLRILAINFFLLPLGTVNNALIQRAMQFDIVARISVIAMTINLAVSVTMAWLGYGAFSLAWGYVALTASSAVLSVVWGPDSAIIRPRLRGASELVRFGAQTTGLSVIWEISARFPEFILGKLQGVADAGLISRATGLASNVNDLLLKGLNPVALSYFSQIRREHGDPLHAHLRMASLVTGLGWPAFVGLAFFAEPLTLALYGERWIGIVWPLRLICLQLSLALPFCFQYQVVMAKGGLDRQVHFGIVSLPFKLLALSIGAVWGALGLAAASALSQMFGIFLASRLVWPSIEVRWRDYWSVVRGNLPIMALTVIACTLALCAGKYWDASYVQLILWYGPLAAVSVIAGYFLLRHPLVDEAKRMMSFLGKR